MKKINHHRAFEMKNSDSKCIKTDDVFTMNIKKKTCIGFKELAIKLSGLEFKNY